jgi:hypothetical protein
LGKAKGVQENGEGFVILFKGLAEADLRSMGIAPAEPASSLHLPQSSAARSAATSD